MSFDEKRRRGVQTAARKKPAVAGPLQPCELAEAGVACRHPVFRRRTGGIIQPESEILLQIRCRCSDAAIGDSIFDSVRKNQIC
jgi:hypothetical protein